MKDDLSKCDVCLVNPMIGVACSSLGPISIAYCRECVDKPAEPFWLFKFTLEEVGPDAADFVKKLFTWKDGKYISWEEFVKDEEDAKEEVSKI